MRELLLNKIKELKKQFGLKEAPPKKGLTRWSYLRNNNLAVWDNEWLEKCSDQELVDSLFWLTACVFRGYA